jgi:flagellar hook-basal body complex protein FliE
MPINGISNIASSINSIGSSTKKTQSESSFTDILSDAINSAQESEGSVKDENAALLTGETDDLHTPVIEAQKAELALDLAIQIRNKVISAYNEVMNMQV